MSSRRGFLKKLGLLTTSSFLTQFPFSKAQGEPHVQGLKGLDKNDSKYWELVRSSFQINDGLVYLNNGTIGPSPTVVQQAIIEKIDSVNANLRYGGGEEVRDSLAALFNVSGDEISLTHNTTEGLNVAAWGLPLSKKDEVIITSHEHVGNAMPWINRSQHDGVRIKTFQPKKTHQEVLNQINDLITKRTKVISIPHISCTIGQNFPIKEVCRLAKDKGIYTVIDGAHGAGGLNLDLKEVQPDVYATCGHKWLLGPKGSGFLYVAKHMLDVVKPVFAGAYTDSGFDITVSPPTFNGYYKNAHRYDFGTQSAAFRYGLKAAAEFHQEIGLQTVQDRIFGLNEYLYQKLIELDSIEMLSSSEQKSRSMMLGFKHKNLDYKTVYKKLLQAKFRIRQVPESNIECLRVSTHVYNTEAQLDAFVEELKSIG